MNTIRRNRFVAIVSAGLLVLAAACGGSESSDDAERDRNISGGAAASQAAHPAPYQVAIFTSDPGMWYSTGKWGFVCSGVVVNAWWVATTAGCVSTQGAPWRDDRFKVGVGFVDPWKPTDWENRDKHMYDVVGSITSGSSTNMALIKLNRPIDFAGISTVRPIDLPFGFDANWPTKGEKGQISGFGFAAGNGARLQNLRTALVEVSNDLTDTMCGDWTNFESGPRLCLSKDSTGGDRAGLACTGDMGGPLVVNVEAKPVLAGIISEVNMLGDCATNGTTLALRAREFARWMASGTISDFAAQPDDGSVTLTWGAPRAVWFAYDASGEWDPGVTDYVIEMSEDGGKTWQTIADGESTATETTIGGLTNGSKYSFRVAALNEVVALTANHRMFTPAIEATIGRVEKPATAPNDGWMWWPEDVPVPALEGQPPVAAAEVAPTPAVAEAAAAPAGAPATTAPANTVAVAPAATVLSTFSPIEATTVASIAKLQVPSGARVSVTVDKSSKKVCAVKGGTLTASSTGKCKVKVAVSTGKGKPKSKTTTISIAK